MYSGKCSEELKQYISEIETSESSKPTETETDSSRGEEIFNLIFTQIKEF
jgi:hypothetical protein